MVKTSARSGVAKTPVKTPSKSRLVLGVGKSSSKKPRYHVRIIDGKAGVVSNRNSQKQSLNNIEELYSRQYLPRKHRSIEADSSEIAKSNKPMFPTVSSTTTKAIPAKSPMKPYKSPYKTPRPRNQNVDINAIIKQRNNNSTVPIKADANETNSQKIFPTGQRPPIASSSSSSNIFAHPPKLSGSNSISHSGIPDVQVLTKDIPISTSSLPLVDGKDIYSPESILEHEVEFRELRRLRREKEQQMKIIIALSIIVALWSIGLYLIGYQPFAAKLIK